MDRRIFVSILVAIIVLLTGCSLFGYATNSSDSRIENYGLDQQLKTDHFKFYSKEQDKSCLQDLSNVLEENYARVTDDLKYSLDKKVDVYIFSDLDTYHNAINQPNAQKWEFTSADAEAIRMVNPSKVEGFSADDLMKSVVHEFVHWL